MQTDGDLLAATASGDREAFRSLVTRYESTLFRYLSAMTSDQAAAEDALQETFVAVWRGASGYRGGPSARGWIFTIGRNALHRRFRRRVGEPSHYEPVDAEHEPLPALGVAAGWGTADPECIVAAAEQRTVLMAALDALAPADREVLVLADLEQLSNKEVGEMLGTTLAATKSRLHRARLRFAAQLRKRMEVADG